METFHNLVNGSLYRHGAQKTIRRRAAKRALYGAVKSLEKHFQVARRHFGLRAQEAGAREPCGSVMDSGKVNRGGENRVGGSRKNSRPTDSVSNSELELTDRWKKRKFKKKRRGTQGGQMYVRD